MPSYSEKNVYIRNILRKRYILALAIIAFLVLSTQFIIQFAISKQENDSRIINIAGRQRMLSQRINKAAFGLYVSDDSNLKNIYFNELKFSVKLWKESHLGLQYGSEKLGLPNENSIIIRKLFKNIEQNHQDMLKATYNILRMTNSGNYNKKELYFQIEKIQKNEVFFLQGMDNIVSQYEIESEKKITFLKQIELALLLATFFIILLEIIFIFKPAENQINKAFYEIQKSRENLINLFEIAPSPMLLVDEESLKIIHLNNLSEKMIGVKTYSAIDLTLSDIFKSIKENDNIISKIKNNKKVTNKEVILCTKYNKNRILLLSSIKITFFSSPTILIGLSDITALKKAKETLRRYATVDEMTGLLNKRSGMLILNSLFQKSKADMSDLSICFIDIDKLKAVNDTYGHHEGDLYIKTVSKVITENMRSQDYAFRYGGDEIVLILDDCDEIKSKSILKRIEKSLSDIENVNNKSYKLSISHGIVSIKSSCAINIDEFINEADKSMYVNKTKK